MVDFQTIGHLTVLQGVGKSVGHPESCTVPETSIAPSVGCAGCPDDALGSVKPKIVISGGF
uniref:Uncharacterized protein n=1 Tax=Mycolicibacterium phage phi1_186018 TaxID=3236641 RepID=A0AB39AKU4_9CAUD